MTMRSRGDAEGRDRGGRGGVVRGSFLKHHMHFFMAWPSVCTWLCSILSLTLIHPIQSIPNIHSTSALIFFCLHLTQLILFSSLRAEPRPRIRSFFFSSFFETLFPYRIVANHSFSSPPRYLYRIIQA